MYMSPFDNMMNWWGGMWIFGWLSMLIFWLLLILGIIALLRYLQGPRGDRGEKKPLDFLKERYAKGEIDKKEFEERKKDLEV